MDYYAHTAEGPDGNPDPNCHHWYPHSGRLRIPLISPNDA